MKSENNYLFVEGALISGGELTTVKLSRTASLADTSYIKPVLFANITVVGEDGTSQSLTAIGNGEYSTILELEPGENYQLSIATAEGKNYQSEIITLKETPPIDSVNWRVVNGSELEILVNTHDVENNSKYYKWDFVETWEFNAAYYSSLEYINGQVVFRNRENQIYTCWQNNSSSSILLGSTAALGEDIIYQKSILKAPFSWKLSKKYSIEINQHALSEEAYNYFENMKKNSEDLGSFYDAQPTEIKGNIHSVSNPDEPVIGYVYATSVEKERIFISNEEVDYRYRDSSCPEDVLMILEPGKEEDTFGKGSAVPIMLNEFGQIIYTYRYCGDCTSKGFNVRPYFWQ